MSVSIFFCYAHEDEALLNSLKAQLHPLVRQGLIDIWYDRNISAGMEWDQEINKHLNEAKIILLLVSPDFMDSDYIYGTEMKRALERHQRGEARVIPIILRAVYWQGLLGNLQALPTDGKPVKSWPDNDEAFYNVTEGIRTVVMQLSQKPVSPSEESLSQVSKQESADGSLTTLRPQPAKPLLSLKPEVMDYLDFELEIGAGSGREYPIVVLHSPGGEAREIMHFPFDELALESHLKDLQIALLRSGGKRRQILSPEEQTVQNFGQALFATLFTGEVRSRYEVSQLAAAHQGKGLRLKLRINAPEMAALPWEFLYDANEAEYVCLSSNTPIVRYIELPRPPQPLTVTPPLRILGMTASPQDLPDLDVEREKQRVEIALKDVRATGAIELTWFAGQTAYDLQRAMQRGPWHIFHFIGHGGFDARTDEGLLALVDEDGRADSLSATHLGRLLADHRSLRLVVLNSCEGAKGSTRDLFSSTAAILVRRGIPAVLAMQYEITDRAAITLSKVFYEALADGTPVDMAVSEARKAISIGIGNTIEWGTPVLYMRSPNGVLFDLIKKPSTPQAQPHPPADVQTPTKPLPSLNSEEVTLLRTLIRHTGAVRSVAFSPDGQTLASGSDDHTIKLWNLASGQELRTLTGHTDWVLSVAFSPDVAMPTPASVSRDTDGVLSMAFSPDGQTLASGGDKTIKLWDVATGKDLRTLKGPFGSVYVDNIFINDPPSVHRWEWQSTNSVYSVALSPDGQTLASGGDGDIKLWDVAKGKDLRTLKGHKSYVSSVAFSPDGQTLASGGYDQTIKLWNLATGRELRTLTGHTSPVESVAFSPDGQTLASGSADKTIKLWNLATDKDLRTLKGHKSCVSSVAFSPDGQTLASGGYDQTIKLWDVATGRELRTLTGHTDWVLSVAFSPDGQTLASGSADKTIKIWGKK